MTVGSIRQRLSLALLLFSGGMLWSASAAHLPPQAPAEQAVATDIILAIDPAHSTLHYRVGSTLHTVHGTFTLKNGALRFDPASGRASGSIVADAASGESGNDSRDKKMHKEVLESASYTEVVFHPDHVDGKVVVPGSLTVQVHGKFMLHGSEHELTVPVQAELDADHWKGTARFAIPYIEWGLKNPSSFVLKVNKTVDIDLEMAGSLQIPKAP